MVDLPRDDETGRRPGAATRSLLFVPADAERKVARALDTTADMVILDLEDAVAPAAKDAARAVACATLRQARRRRIAIRVNAADTDWHVADLAAIAGLAPDIVMLPKCAGPADVALLSGQLAVLEAAAGVGAGTIAILPLVTETAVALGSLDYRHSSSRLFGLGFAGEDLSADLGVAARDADGMNPLLAHARRAVAIAAAAAGVAAIDTPFPDPRDPAGLARESAMAARLGFAGKMCIHPGQLDTVNRTFTPAAEAIAWARAVIACFANPTEAGVMLLDGKMIDRAHLRLAERYLRQAGTEETSP